MRRPRSRAASNSGKSESAAARLRSAVAVVRSMAIFRVASTSAVAVRVLNGSRVLCMGSALLADSRPLAKSGQNFDRVKGAYPRASPAELARHVHQAAEIAAEQDLGPGLLDGGGLLLDHSIGNGRVFDAEGTAEAAADVVALEFTHLEPDHLAQKGAGLGMDAEFAQARATVVIGARCGERAPFRDVTDDIDEEAENLVSLRPQRLGPLPPGLIAGERLQEMGLDHAGAGARWNHDVVERLEGLDHTPGEPGGGFRIAAVEGGLPATGLRGWHLDVAAGLLQKLQAGKADTRAHCVDEAGHEQADPSGGACDWARLHDASSRFYSWKRPSPDKYLIGACSRME